MTPVLSLVRRTSRTVVLAAAALSVLAVVTVAARAPVAWWLLGVCAVVSLAILVPAIAQRRFFEPLTLVSAIALVSFVARPLFIFINSRDLLSFLPPGSSVDSLLQLDSQEISRFSTVNLHGLLQPALTRAIGACAVFLVFVVVGCAFPHGRRLANRLSRADVRTAGGRTSLVVLACFVIGLAGQIAIVAKTGGFRQTADTQIKQEAQSAGLVLQVLAGFAITALVVWATQARPSTTRTRLGLGVAVLEVCAFYALIGSRSRVFAIVLTLSVVAHYLWRPLRVREVLVVTLAVVLFAAGALGVRQATYNEPFGTAIRSAPKYILDPRGVINDVTGFDQLFTATSTIGVTLQHKEGAWLVDAFRSYVPRALDHGKPGSGDVEFRKSVWGNEVGAGRPPTIVGDLFYDFGFAGIAGGALLLGVVMRGLLGLVSGARESGRRYRVGLYALSLVLLYQLVVGTYSIVIGSFITLVVPYLIAVHLPGRAGFPDLPLRAGRRRRRTGAEV